MARFRLIQTIKVPKKRWGLQQPPASAIEGGFLNLKSKGHTIDEAMAGKFLFEWGFIVWPLYK